MGQRARWSQQDDRAENQSHGAGVEEPLDDVNSNLVAERQAGLLRDQVGTHGIGNAANERHRGEADHLRSQQREQRHLFDVAQQQRPAHRAKDIAYIDAAESKADLAPVGQFELGDKDVKVKVNPVAPPNNQRDQRQKKHRTQNQLAFLQDFSVPAVINLCCLVSHLNMKITSAFRLLLRCRRLSCLRCCSLRLGFARQYSAIELVNDTRHIDSSLAVRGNAVVLIHRLRTGVVGSQSQRHVVVVASEQRIQIRCPAAHVFVRLEAVRNAQALGGCGHQLHQALPPLSAFTRLASKSTSRLCS